MKHAVTLIPGDWIGPEMAASVQHIIAAAGVEIEWDTQICGLATYESEKNLVPPRVIDSIRQTRVALKGRLGTPVGATVSNANALLRKHLDLYCNIRPVRNRWGIQGRYPELDIVIIRESLEDVYVGIEHEVIPGVVETLKVTTARECERISRAAFEYARAHKRKKVTTVHKANIMKMADGLFLETSRRVAKEFPEIQHNDIIVDNCAMQLVARPQQFDVMLMGNLFGDMISDLCAGLTGGISLEPSIIRNDEGVFIFESPHGQAPELVGKGRANPLPLLTPALYMLRHLGELEAAQRIDDAIGKAIFSGVTTRDLGGLAGSEEFSEAIISCF